MTAKCPCCGAAVDPMRIIVDFNTQTVTFGENTRHLDLQLLRLFDLLHRAAPRAVSGLQIGEELWNNDVVIEGHINTAISRTRRLIRPLGLIIRNYRATGWRLEVPDQAAQRDQPHGADDAKPEGVP